MSYAAPVATYMTTNPVVIAPEASVRSAAELMLQRRISALAVTDESGSIVGVLSRTDLLHLPQDPQGPSPSLRVKEIMTQGPLLVEPTTPLHAAASELLAHRIHRLFVVDHGKLVGVISTKDMARAVSKSSDSRPMSAIMKNPISAIDQQASISAAKTQLEQAGVTGLIVLDDGWPIGMFSQTEALAIDPSASVVADVVDHAMICLPHYTSIPRAASYTADLDVRRIIACKGREPIGIVTGSDFTRIVAGLVTE